MSLEHRATSYALEDGTEVISSAGLVDGRDPSTDGSKLDAIEPEADITDAANVSAAGAGMVAEAKAWTRCQYPTPQTLVLDTGAITPAFGSAGHGNAFYYDMANGAAQLANATGLVAGMRFEIMIEADGVNELTYGDRYDFGAVDGTDVDPPDISAMTNGQWLVLYATVKADTAGGIGLAASVVYG